MFTVDGPRQPVACFGVNTLELDGETTRSWASWYRFFPGILCLVSQDKVLGAPRSIGIP